MKKIKKFLSSLIAIMIVATMVTSNLSALEVNSSFVQNTNTSNTYGYVNYETDQFETYSKVSGSAGNYTSIASKVYKPLSGDTLIVVFHGNGEGGVDGVSNNYSQIAAKYRDRRGAGQNQGMRGAPGFLQNHARKIF